MKHGPLHAVPGGLAVAPPAGLHVQLTPAEITHRRGAEQLAVFAWDQVESIRLALPVSRFPAPRALALSGYTVLTLLSGQAEGPAEDESTGRVTIATTDAAPTALRVQHALGGYWTRAVTHAQTLIDGLVAHPERRSLLARSDEIVRRYARATRWGVRGVSGL